MEATMARLADGEKEQITNNIQNLLQRSYNGIRESEIADITEMDRRRVNNYLRELQENEKAYKDGWEWYAS